MITLSLIANLCPIDMDSRDMIFRRAVNIDTSCEMIECYVDDLENGEIEKGEFIEKVRDHIFIINASLGYRLHD